MVNEDNVNESPIRDFLFQMMLLDYDITHKEMKDSIYDTIIYMLDYLGVESNFISYLDYDIKKVKNEHIKVVSENIITALWFIGILPQDCDSVYENNLLEYDGKLYKFNKKTKKLTWKRIKK